MDSLDIIKSIIKSYIDDKVLRYIEEEFLFGKMLRSKLILSIAPKTKDVFSFCAIIELIHLASLLHDDVIDGSNMRRGKLSINAIHGDNIAIMLGDILYSKAFYEVSLLSQSISCIVSQAVLKLSLGELEDVKLSNKFNDNEDKYLLMIENKTAALIEASTYGAGILSGESSDKYKNYGRYLGIAYQIIDDLLDLTKSDVNLGKNSLNDFKNGKTTLPYIYLFHSLNKDSKDILVSYFKKDLNDSQKQWIKDQIEKFNIIAKVKELAIFYGEKAIESLDSKDKKLINIMKNMIFRDY